MNKYLLTPLNKRFSTLFVLQEQLNEWILGWRFFFILGFGRSGTAFMANFLDQGEGAHVFHEPVLEDFLAHLRAHYSPVAAERYMQGFRKKEIYLRMRNIAPGIYGETNSILRCHAAAIGKSFPEATLLHLVRDGRDVVRSHMSRRTMTGSNPFSMNIHPIETDRWYPHWQEMDRFARICWYWQEENRRLRISIRKTVQFEKVLASYEYFHEEILTPCGIFIDKKNWEGTIASPRNVTEKFQMPKWAEWTPHQQKSFRDICGSEMEACGYSL